jgi:hypothetical protein
MLGGEGDYTRRGTRLRALTLLATGRSPGGRARGVPLASDDGAHAKVRRSDLARDAAPVAVVLTQKMVAALRSA